MGEPSKIKAGGFQKNPFPGNRPFLTTEENFFYGRRETVAELRDILLKNRFVALVGASASGKTSLIQSGIIPALLAQKGPEWVAVLITPGEEPMESLIRGFQQQFPKKISESDVKAFLTGSKKIGELLVEKELSGKKFVLVVDQFEELFTFPALRKNRKKSGKSPESRQFVNQLIQAADDKLPGIYVMLSFRSGFLNACLSFRELTEHINKSKYLLPRMTREALSASITEPIHQAGVSVVPGFEQHILDEVEDLEYQLPLLQHAMQQTWNHWLQRHQPDQPIDLDDFQAAGTLLDGPGQHMEEAYDALDYHQKRICERMFKTIAFKHEGVEIFSRHAALGSIARVAKCSVDELTGVAAHFMKPGRTFLTLSTTTLSFESKVNLAHISLISMWDRLQTWVDEEAESIKMYLELSDASLRYQQGRDHLWTPPQLLTAVKWRESQEPDPAWGIQFDPAFERAMVFLKTSEEEYVWNEERKVIRHRRRRILSRSIAIGSVIIMVAVAVVIFVFRLGPMEGDQKEQATSENISEPAESRVQPVPVPVEEQNTLPDDEPTSEPVREETVAEVRPGPQGNPRQADSRIAETQTSDTQRSGTRQSGTDRSESESTTTEKRVPARELTTTQTEPVETVSMNASRLSLARDVAIQSTLVSGSPDLQGLLAYQSYLFNERYQGDAYDRDVYYGLYEAKKNLISLAYNIYPNVRQSVKAIEWLDRSGSILIACSDGSLKILSGTLAKSASQISLVGTGMNNECLGVSPDERTAVIGTNGGGLAFIELESKGEVIYRNTSQGNIIFFIENLGNSGNFLSAGVDNRILKWDYASFNSTPLLTAPGRISAMVTSRDGSRLFFGTRNGKLFSADVNNPGGVREIKSFGSKYVTALEVSPGRQYLVAGLLDGSLMVLSGEGQNTIEKLGGPSARVTDVAFSPDGKFLVAGSHDGNVYLWNTSNWSDPPLVFTENSGFVHSVCFSRNSQYFFSGSAGFPRMVGRPASSGQMAGDFCSLLNRNLTREEWANYFGEVIPYEETCPK